MNRKNLITLLMILTLALPFAASADRFYLNSADLEPGKTETLQFILENTQDFYGFQAEVRLPAGLEAVKDSDGELDITLSERADEGRFMVNSNVLADGSLIISAFSANHTPFLGNDGVLANLKVAVSDSFAGGKVEVYNIMFTDSQNMDVDLESTTTYFSGTSGVDAVFGKVASADVYDMNGVLVKKEATRDALKQLTPGTYILRSGNAAVKAVIR